MACVYKYRYYIEINKISLKEESILISSFTQTRNGKVIRAGQTIEYLFFLPPFVIIITLHIIERYVLFSAIFSWMFSSSYWMYSSFFLFLWTFWWKKTSIPLLVFFFIFQLPFSQIFLVGFFVLFMPLGL